MMLNSDMTASNLFYLAAANASLATSGDPEWDACFAEYMMCDALNRADAAFGDNAKAHEAYVWAKFEISGKYGKNFRGNPEAKALYEAANTVLELTTDLTATEFY